MSESRRITFEPSAAQNASLTTHGVEPSGERWAALIAAVMEVRDPDRASVLEFRPTEDRLEILAPDETTATIVRALIEELRSDQRMLLRSIEHTFPTAPIPEWHV